MRFSELPDQQRAALIQEFLTLRVVELPEFRRAQWKIAVCFAAAGFCAFGCLRAIGLGPTMTAAALLFLFALGSAYFFGTAWTKLTSHNVMMRADERAYLALVFDRCAENGIEFSTQDAAHFLRFAPDRPA